MLRRTFISSRPLPLQALQGPFLFGVNGNQPELWHPTPANGRPDGFLNWERQEAVPLQFLQVLSSMCRANRQLIKDGLSHDV